MTVTLQVPVADVRDGDTVTDVTPRPNPERGFLPRQVDLVNVRWPDWGVTVAGQYLANGFVVCFTYGPRAEQDAGRGRIVRLAITPKETP